MTLSGLFANLLFFFTGILLLRKKTRDSKSNCFARTRKGHLSSPGSLAPTWLSLAVFTFFYWFRCVFSSTPCDAEKHRHRQGFESIRTLETKQTFPKENKEGKHSNLYRLFFYDLRCLSPVLLFFSFAFLCLESLRGKRLWSLRNLSKKPYYSSWVPTFFWKKLGSQERTIF